MHKILVSTYFQKKNHFFRVNIVDHRAIQTDGIITNTDFCSSTLSRKNPLIWSSTHLRAFVSWPIFFTWLPTSCSSSAFSANLSARRLPSLCNWSRRLRSISLIFDNKCRRSRICRNTGLAKNRKLN